MKVSIKINKNSIEWLKPVKEGSVVKYIENNIPTFVNSFGKEIYTTKVDYGADYDRNIYQKNYFVDSLTYETINNEDFVTFNLLESIESANNDDEEIVDTIIDRIYKHLVDSSDESDSYLLYEHLIKMYVTLKGKYSLSRVTGQTIYARFNEAYYVDVCRKNNINFKKFISETIGEDNENDISLPKLELRNKKKTLDIDKINRYFSLFLEKNLFDKENQLFICPYFISRYVHDYFDDSNDLDSSHIDKTIKVIEKAETILVIGNYIFKDYKQVKTLSYLLIQAFMSKEENDIYREIVLHGKNYPVTIDGFNEKCVDKLIKLLEER